jgi:hypothetical protein
MTPEETKEISENIAKLVLAQIGNTLHGPPELWEMVGLALPRGTYRYDCMIGGSGNPIVLQIVSHDLMYLSLIFRSWDKRILYEFRIHR